MIMRIGDDQGKESEVVSFADYSLESLIGSTEIAQVTGYI
jgi:hypothetical protein